MTPQTHAARRKSDEDSAVVQRESDRISAVETTARKSSQCSTPASAGSMSTQQRFDKASVRGQFDREENSPSTSTTSSQRRERCSAYQGQGVQPEPKQGATVKIEAWRLVCVRGSAKRVLLQWHARQRSDDTRGPDPDPSPSNWTHAVPSPTRTWMTRSLQP